MSTATALVPYSDAASTALVPYHAAPGSDFDFGPQPKQVTFNETVQGTHELVKNAISDIDGLDSSPELRREVRGLVNHRRARIYGGEGLDPGADAWTNPQLAGLRSAIDTGAKELHSAFDKADLDKHIAMRQELRSQATGLTMDVYKHMHDLDTKQTDTEAQAQKAGLIRSGINIASSLGGAAKRMVWGSETQDNKDTEVANESAERQTDAQSVMPNSEHGPFKPQDAITLTVWPEGDKRNQLMTEHTAGHNTNAGQQEPRAEHRAWVPAEEGDSSQDSWYPNTNEGRQVLVRPPAQSMVHAQPTHSTYTSQMGSAFAPHPQAGILFSSASTGFSRAGTDLAGAMLQQQAINDQQQAMRSQQALHSYKRGQLESDVFESVHRLSTFDALSAASAGPSIGFGTGVGSVLGVGPLNFVAPFPMLSHRSFGMASSVGAPVSTMAGGSHFIL